MIGSTEGSAIASLAGSSLSAGQANASHQMSALELNKG
jgi:hypothetical protein